MSDSDSCTDCNGQPPSMPGTPTTRSQTPGPPTGEGPVRLPHRGPLAGSETRLHDAISNCAAAHQVLARHSTGATDGPVEAAKRSGRGNHTNYRLRILLAGSANPLTF